MRRGVIDIPVRRLVRTLGFDVERKRPVLIDLLSKHRVGTVLDVGANVGQYARRLRAWGYQGRIVSFEPLPCALEILMRDAAKDPLWDVRGFALGEKNGRATINVSEASVFSSIQAGRPELYSAFASALPIATEEISVYQLDSVFEELPRSHGAVFLKVDTQGFERQVIHGASRSLESIEGVQLEISLTPLYEGEGTLAEISQIMHEYGYAISLIEPVAYEPRSQNLLQIDCTFFRRHPLDGGSATEQKLE